MANETQVLMRTSEKFADELRARAKSMSDTLGRKVSVAECVERTLRGRSYDVVAAEFAVLVDTLRSAADEVFEEWPVVDGLWLDLSVRTVEPMLVIEGDADFIIGNGLSIMQFAKMSRRMSEKCGFDVIVTSQPRESWRPKEDVDAYEGSKVEVWRRHE